MSGHLLESVAVPAVAVMLLGARHLALGGRMHWAQALGVVASFGVMALAADMISPRGPATSLVPLLGLLPAVLVARWAPGVIPSLLVALLAFVSGGAFLDGQVTCEGCLLIAYGAWFAVLGAVGAVVLAQHLPPPAMTLTLGLGSWLLGTAYLLGAPPPPQWESAAQIAGWVSAGLLCAAALVHGAGRPSLLWGFGLVTATVLLSLDAVPVVTVGVLAADSVILWLMYRRLLPPHLRHIRRRRDPGSAECDVVATRRRRV